MLTAIRGAGLFPFNISRRRQAIFQISTEGLETYAREKNLYVYLSWKSRQSFLYVFLHRMSSSFWSCFSRWVLLGFGLVRILTRPIYPINQLNIRFKEQGSRNRYLVKRTSNWLVISTNKLPVAEIVVAIVVVVVVDCFFTICYRCSVVLPELS